MNMFRWVIGLVFAGAILLGPAQASAITITISPSATMQVGTNNTVTISPITLHTPLPGYPTGDYSVQFRWDPAYGVLVPTAATRLGGDVRPIGGAVGTEVNGVLIETETFTPDSLMGCTFRVQAFNRAANTKSTILYYNAFNAAGNGIGFAYLFQLMSPNSRSTLSTFWVTPTSQTIRCSQIARYELDLSISSALP
ncbi:hypothetical protein HYZ80_00660 [Candidatus Parcubacteria bacterium]|nr:hypothetical protein [Candidatus Parcubacteria bacterium]